MSSYGLSALERLRERQAAKPKVAEAAGWTLDQIPPDVPMDDATLTVWNGERFVDWDAWRATAPVSTEDAPTGWAPDVTALIASRAGLRVRIVRDGERWLIFAGTKRVPRRRQHFSTPFLEHAIRVAADWYGLTLRDWREDSRDDAKVEVLDRGSRRRVAGPVGHPLLE